MKKLTITNKQGFALVATISIVSLILFIALALVSLSTVVTRTSDHSNHIQIAKANARLALSEAIAKLQESLGPDTRVSANAEILSGVHSDKKYLLGVWKSLGEEVGGVNMGVNPSGQAGGSPVYTGTFNLKDGVANSYVTNSDGIQRSTHFHGWLAPGNPGDGFHTIASQDSSGDALDGFIQLIGENTLGGHHPDKFVSMPLQTVNQGRYTYHISGENQKARINLSPDGSTASSTRLNAAPTMNSSILSDWSTYDETSAEKHISLNTAYLNDGTTDLPENAKVHYHAVSPYSVGLFTNTRWGGLKYDLSLMTERDSGMGLGAVDQIYDGGQRYDFLRNYCRLYKSPADGGIVEWNSGVPEINTGVSFADTVSKPAWREYTPVLSKWYWVISHYSIKTGLLGSEEYQLRMTLDQVVELWNPFTLPFKGPRDSSNLIGGEYRLKVWAMPYALKYKINGVDWSGSSTNTAPKHLMWMYTDQATGERFPHTHDIAIKLDTTMEPGQHVLFTNKESTPIPATYKSEYAPGFRSGAGIFSDQLGHGGNNFLRGAAGDAVQVEIIADSSFKGIYGSPYFADFWFRKDETFDLENPDNCLEISVQFHEATNDVSSVALDVPPTGNELDLASAVGAGNAIPCAAVGFRLKVENSIPTPTSTLTPSQLLDRKIYREGEVLGGMSKPTPDPNMTALSPYEYFSQSLESNADYPFIEVDGVSGYGGTSHGPRDEPGADPGQTHIPLIEIPFAPLVSLAQLQHARLGNTPWSKFGNGTSHFPNVNNAFGNSYAPSMVTQNQYKMPSMPFPQRANASGVMYDKSYLHNEAMWDTWFFSTISDQTNDFVASPDRVSYEDLLSDALEGKRQLPNRRYKFSRFYTGPRKAEIISDISGSSDGWKRVAQYMRCEGAFNVNSTSLEAWRAFLTSLNGESITYIDAKTNSPTTETASYYISRFMLPSAPGAENAEYGTDKAQFLERRWKAARKLTLAEVNELANAMVAQVKKRGPFLSMGDFINRRLTNDPEGLKGAVQEAIDSTSINHSFGSVDNTVTGTSKYITEASLPAMPNKKAASGLQMEGAPGYITQADLLTPLAPVLRVRDDTFVVRAYGDSLDKNGNVMAYAYCEAVIQRGYNLIDSSQNAAQEVKDPITWGWGNKAFENSLTATNDKYGRRFHLIKFRWLSKNEI